MVDDKVPAQRKRGPKRTHDTPGRSVTIWLYDDVAAALDVLSPNNRSAYIDKALRERPDVQAALRTPNEQIS